MEKQNKCIFIIDDNVVNLNAGRMVLQDHYTVVTIPSGEKLLQLIQRKKPDLILLDIEMPEMNGYEVLKKLKADPDTSGIPVIFLTGKSDPENELHGLSLGAVDYIAKPFSPPLLLKRIELYLLLVSQKNELLCFNEQLQEMVDKKISDITALQNAIIKWAADLVEFRDEETGQHVSRVQKYMALLMTEMQNDPHYEKEVAAWDRSALLQSAALHDVGKIKISDSLLLKPGRLTDDEFSIMKQHTEYGLQLIESLEKNVPDQTFLRYTKVLAQSHHERWDGHGYPQGLHSDAIPLQARMMTLADVYDALVSDRPYKKAFTHERAMEIIFEGRGTQFDPHLTDIFLSISNEIKKVSEAH